MPKTVEEIMALASVMATKRVLRYRASLSAVERAEAATKLERAEAATKLERAETAVERATDELRTALEELCPKSSNAPSSSSAN